MSKHQPLVTLYIVNYNYCRYLEKAIKSALNQTYDNLEILIIDDGSTDKSHLIIDEYEQNKLIRVFRGKNEGLIACCNKALQNANGEFIIRLDADDYFAKDAIQLLVKKILDNPSVGLVFPDYWEINEHDSIIKRVRRFDFDKDVSLLNLPAHGAGTLFKKKLLISLGGYDESFTRQDGYDMWLKIIRNHKVTNINKPLFFYRQHSNNLTKDKVKLLKTRNKILEKHFVKAGFSSSTAALIPIRGNSDSEINFSLAPLGEKKLIQWTIDNALRSKYLKYIFVMSSSKKIKGFLEGLYQDKIFFINRDISDELMNTSIDTSLGYLEKLDFIDDLDSLLILNQEYPFRGQFLIDSSIFNYKLFGLDTVIVAEQDNSVFFKHNGHTLVKTTKEKLKVERNYIFKQVGGLTLVDLKQFAKSRNILGKKIGHLEADQLSSFRISTDLDMEMAEMLAENKHERD